MGKKKKKPKKLKKPKKPKKPKKRKRTMPRPTRPAQNPATIIRDQDELQTVMILWTLDDSDPPVLIRAVKMIREAPDVTGILRLNETTVFEGEDAALDAMVDNLLTKVDALT